MANSNRSYRSSQLISTFGPGSIIDIGEESLILMDINHWPKNLEEITLDRLTREAGIWSLKKPPVLKERWGNIHKNNALLTVRFPAWMFCPRCKHLKHRTNEDPINDKGVPICTNSACPNKTLVPMRFVAACNHGHLQDIPWNRWAHLNQSQECPSPKDQLYFRTRNDKGSGLSGMHIHCKNCNAKNPLDSIMLPGSLKISCSDKQPWEYKDHANRQCKEVLKVVQRGASNLYYPIIRSALDIPVEAKSKGNPIIKKIQDAEDYRDLLRALERKNERRALQCAEDLAEEFGFSAEEIIDAVKNGGEPPRVFKIPDDKDLRFAEWEILSAQNIDKQQTNNFKTRTTAFSDTQSYGFNQFIKKIVLLDKLREVRAFCGFERITPGSNPVLMKTDNQKSWLPACEVFGEGIFIEFSQEALNEWKNLSSSFINSRLQHVQKRYVSLASTYLPEPTSKFIALHTLSHLIIRQLSFESGYSSGSLRERIYAENGQAGILIYTADGDSEGSLGGLVQQGEANRFFPAIIAALETANWCSNDPVCSELETQGVMGLNKAACHSCTLVSETSCEYNNLLLDRKLLIGDEKEHGLFSSIIKILNKEYS